MRQLRRIEELEGYSLLARNGEIGRIEEMYFDDKRWLVRYFSVRTGGWLLGREVLIAPRAITGVDEENRRIAVDLTREQIEKSPPVGTEKPVSRHYEAEYHRYYSWPPYWEGGSFGGSAPVAPRPMPPATAEPPQEPEHPRLRASDEVCGYRIRARDDELGKVEDFIVDDRDWKVRYVVVDTRRWLPGKKVLVAPAWVDSIDWVGNEIAVDLDRKTIESAPPYDPSQVIGRDYEVRLYEHYGKSLQENGEPGGVPEGPEA